jgi:hypothetical protein
MLIKRIFFTLLLLPLASCGGLSVKTEAVDNETLMSYQTFAWRYPAIEPKTIREDTLAKVDKHFRRKVNNLLEEKGYQKTVRADADLLLEYQFGRDVPSPESSGLEASSPGLVDQGRLGLIEQSGSFSAPDAGKTYLQLELKDAKTNQSVWQARVKKSVEFESPDDEQLKKVVHNAAKKMLRAYPSRN